MNKIETEDLPKILQDIYQRLMVDADEVGLAYDEVLQYVMNFEMDEDMLLSFIRDRVNKNKKRKEVRKVMESLKSSLRDPYISR